MTPARPALVAVALTTLALGACGDGRSGRGEGDAPDAPIGFELALVSAAAPAPGDDGDDNGADAAPSVSAPAPVIDVSPEELSARLAAGNVRLIDVRTDAEVAEGIIPGAEHIPLDRFDPAALGPPDGRGVVLYCRSGRRSAIAGEKLAAALGTPVEHLAGGILAWEAAGKPIDPH